MQGGEANGEEVGEAMRSAKSMNSDVEMSARAIVVHDQNVADMDEGNEDYKDEGVIDY